jgi:hypothetical protein
MSKKEKRITVKKVYITSVVAIFIGIFVFGLIPAAISASVAPAPAVDESSADEGMIYEPVAAGSTNGLSASRALPGDIILLGTDGTFFDYLIPGKFSHTVLYCGKVKSGEKIWDRDAHRWMSAGTHYVIHSTKSDNAGNGLGYSTWYNAVNAHADNAMILRVLKSNGGTLSSYQRNGIVSWAKSKLSGGTDGYPIGPKYDWGWWGKQTGVDSCWPAPKGYYCSELAWAAYKVKLGICLDSDTSPFNIGVSPDDLWHSQYTSVIAYEWGGTRRNIHYDIVKLTVFVDEVYYDTDYDPWPSGAGEMYLVSRSGVGYSADGKMLATEQQAPGNGKIGNSPSHWSRNGRGALNWNKYFYSLVCEGWYMRIRIEAWEKDSWPNGDDRYPVWQWYWSYSTWRNYQDRGWYTGGYRVDKGDCRYTIKFRIDTVY